MSDQPIYEMDGAGAAANHESSPPVQSEKPDQPVHELDVVGADDVGADAAGHDVSPVQSKPPGQHTYEFNIVMACSGCSGAVKRAFDKLSDVDRYEVSLPEQNAWVVTALPFKTVLQTIIKTGKKINSAKADGVEQPVEIPAAA